MIGDPPPTGIDVRPVTPQDAPAIVSILNPIIAARCYTVLDRELTTEEERAFIARFPSRGLFLAAVDRTTGGIVGFQNVEPFAAYTRAFDHVGVIGTYVRLDRRGQGIGRQLFRSMSTAAMQQGYEKLFTFIRSDNPGALRSYQRFGFHVVGVATGHARIDGRNVDEVIVEKWLAGAPAGAGHGAPASARLRSSSFGEVSP